MKVKKLAQPSRNFCMFNGLVIPEDPKDGREKYVAASYVAGGIGRLVFIDTHSKEGEALSLPDDEGAWALWYLPEKERLLVGTCANYGYLHSLNLRTRTWDKSLRLDETYLWNFVQGKNGHVYASTYPGCILADYDPETHTLTSTGHVGTVEKNLYSKNILANADGNIIANAGYEIQQIFIYDVDKKEYIRVGEDGDYAFAVSGRVILAENKEKNEYRFYDAYTHESVEKPVSKDVLNDLSVIKNDDIRAGLEKVKNPPYFDKLPVGGGTNIRPLKDGRVMGIRGQEYFIIDGDEVTFDRIPTEAPPTNIMTVAVDEEGVVWGSSELGQTICNYNPKTGEHMSTPAVTNEGGEVYGICPKDGKVFLTAYVGGDHIVYDPKKPWNQHDNVNPKTLRSVHETMIRPHGKSVIGPDGNIWTGWSANYGVYGGGLTRINTKTYEVDDWFGIIPEQSMENVAAGEKYIYAVSSGGTSGLPDKKDKFYILCFDTDANIVWKKQYELGILFHKILVTNGYVLVSEIDTIENKGRILVFRENTMEELPAIELGTPGKPCGISFNCYEKNVATHFIPYDETSIIVFAGKKAMRMEIPSGKILDECEAGGDCNTATIDADKNVYYAVGPDLYLLEV